MCGAFSAFGAPLDDLTIADLRRQDTAFQIGVAPQHIDVLTGIDGVYCGRTGRACRSRDRQVEGADRVGT